MNGTMPMTKIENWISKKLKAIDANEFIQYPHQKTPPCCIKKFRVSYYEIPLSNKIGSSVLVVPNEHTENKNILILLFHGMGDDCTYPLWHWFDIFTSRGISVLSINWDGHGTSSSSLLNFNIVDRSLPCIIKTLFSKRGK